MNDSTSWFPETNTILGSSGGKKVVDFFVDILGSGKIFVSFNLSLDQMVTMDGGGDSNLINYLRS